MQSQNYFVKKGIWLREAVWPTLEPEGPQVIFPEEILVVEDENLDQAFILITKFSDSEDERRKTVESKATLLLSTISVATTVIVASNTLLTNKSETTWPVVCSVGIAFLLCLYTSMTVWYAIKALQRGSYHTLTFKEINIGGDPKAYKRHLILATWNQTRGNFKTINNKVDYMHMAQLFYQRGIIVIGLYALLIFLFCLFYRQPIDDKLNPVVVSTIKTDIHSQDTFSNVTYLKADSISKHQKISQRTSKANDSTNNENGKQKETPVDIRR